MELFNPQLLSQYAKLDSIQVVQLLMLLLVGGMMWLNVRQQGVAKQTLQNFNEMTTRLLGTMQTQQTQSNDRESKLSTSIDRQAGESNKIARALILIHKEQGRQGVTNDDTQRILKEQHVLEMAKLELIHTDLKQIKDATATFPAQSQEVKNRLDALLGHLEILIPRIRSTGEHSKVPADADVPTPDTRAKVPTAI